MKYIIFLLIILLPTSINAQTSSPISIDELTINEIQESIRKGYITYEQLINIYMERINEYNDEYNAIITVNESAIDEAIALDKEYNTTGQRSELHGIPILVKDNIDVIGMPTTNGTTALLDAYPNKDADIVEKLKEAGAIIIGKANMDEFAFKASYSQSSHGYVYNAYNLLYSSYGSSGGSAVGVAANLAVAAIGTDTNLSIRLPSASAGVVGLRPTQDNINGDGIIKYDSVRDVAGPITKYVEDNAIILEIIDNTDIDYTIERENLNDINIIIFEDLITKSTQFIEELIKVQEEHLIDLEANLIYKNAIYIEQRFNENSTCYEFNEYIKNTSSSITSLEELINTGGYIKPISGLLSYCNNDYKETSYYKEYLNYQEDMTKIVENYFKDLNADVIIYPTSMNEIIKISEIGYKSISTYGYQLSPITGYPSISIPIGYYNDLPYGMEILTTPGNEKLLYEISYLLEEKNNFYKLPEIAPSLYEIPNEVTKLIEYLDLTEINNRELQTKVNEFMLNYNDLDDKSSAAVELKKEIEEQMKFEKSMPMIINNLLLITVLLLLIFSIILMKIRNEIKNNARKKYLLTKRRV